MRGDGKPLCKVGDFFGPRAPVGVAVRKLSKFISRERSTMISVDAALDERAQAVRAVLHFFYLSNVESQGYPAPPRVSKPRRSAGSRRTSGLFQHTFEARDSGIGES